MIYLLGAIVLFPLLPFFLPFVGYAFWLFGRQPVSKSAIKAYKIANNMEVDEDAFEKVGGIAKILANTVWFLFGIILCILHLISGVLNLVTCITIILAPVCLPNALAHFKLAKVALFPFGVNLVSTDLARDILKEKAKARL